MSQVESLSEHDFAMKKRRILREFIQLYESYPCLWNVKSKEYHKRNLRVQAYKVLAQKLQQIQPGADHQSVVKKINCLRSNVRKEKTKTLNHLRSGVVYKTKLWYYHLFDFLDQIGNRQSADLPVTQVTLKSEEDESSDPLDNSISCCEVEEYKNISTYTEEQNMATIAEIGNVISQPSSSRNHNKVNFKETVEDNCNGERDDRHDVFGRNVAMKLRHISTVNDTQRIMAEKIINESLYMAEMGLLGQKTSGHVNNMF